MDEEETLITKATSVAPDLIEMTQRFVFGEIWERSALSKRDRSLVSIAILIATGRWEPLPGYLRRGRDNGLTDEEIGEIVTHSAVYAGWPSAITAARVVNDTLGFDLRHGADG